MYTLTNTVTILVIGSLLLVTFGMIQNSSAAEFEVVVSSEARAFTPQVVRIKLGDSVKWVNQDRQDHFLTSAGPSTKQIVVGTESLEIHKLLHPSENYRHVFKEAESYHYFCAIHLQMWGTVVVEK